MSEEAEASTEVSGDEQAVSEAVAEQSNTAPEWLQAKYITDDRSIEESTAEQAKAYVELNKQFGSFTGSPDEYELSLSDELAEKGVELADDDPLLNSFKEKAKEMGINQEGFNQLVGVYVESQLAEQQALQDMQAESMKELGPNADRRIENIIDWGKANMDEETFAGLEEAANSASAVKAIEALIAKTRNAPVANKEAPAAPSITHEQVRIEKFRKDDNGNLLMQTDPEHRAKVRKMYDDLVGTGENRVTVG